MKPRKGGTFEPHWEATASNNINSKNGTRAQGYLCFPRLYKATVYFQHGPK